MQSIEERVRAIEERNRNVEAAKAWETSITRIVSIVVLTYIVTTIVFISIGTEHPFRNAIIPTLGFLLSIQSVPFLKKRWIAAHQKKSI